MTRYGINPSYCNWSSRLPLFADPMRRARLFEVFKEDGTPTGDPSPLGPDGWPVVDGRWHGVRLFGDQDGFMPADVETWDERFVWANFKVNPGKSCFVSWKGGKPQPMPKITPNFGDWHLPSMEALQYFRPKVLRTLDWGFQARKGKRPDWSKPRVKPTDPLQGEEMALELHCKAANALGANLWWNAPPRFELPVGEYRARLTEMLEVIKDLCDDPPIIEYGNELWNEGFPVHNWLKSSTPAGSKWYDTAAEEIDLMRGIVRSVFGDDSAKAWIFVGGHIGNPDTLDQILGYLGAPPDIAGPAFYVPPLKADKDRWAQTGAIPTQEELEASLRANLPSLRTKLAAHRNILAAHGVPKLGIYEANASMIANGKPWRQAAIQAQKEPWLGDLIREIRAAVEAEQAHTACWYSAATDQTPADKMIDCWGFLEATLDKASPLPKAVAARGGA